MLDLKQWNQPAVRGCLGNLLLYAVVAAAVMAARVAVSTKRIDVADTLFMSLVAAAPLSFGLLYWWGITWTSGDRELIRAALRGARRDDGKRVAVVGSIEPLGKVLHAPFTGRACVAYWYQVVAPRTARNHMDLVYFWGFHLAPSCVSGDSGEVPLRGYFTQPRWESLTREIEIENASAYLKSTVFSSAPAPSNALSELRQMNAPSASFRRDFSKNQPAPDLDTLVIEECCLEPGDIVCALGRYSTADGGLIADPTRTVGIDLKAGQPKDVLEALGSWSMTSLLLGAAGIVIGLFLAAIGIR